MEKTGQEILIDYIKEDTQDSEKSMQNLIFKDDFRKNFSKSGRAFSFFIR